MNTVDNERQADVTRSWIKDFSKTLAEIEKKGDDGNPVKYELYVNAHKGMIKDLEGQLALYELKKEMGKQLTSVQYQAIITITFEEFLDYAKKHSPEPHWSFQFLGYPVTHENNQLYLIPTYDHVLRFHSDEVLCIRNDRSIFTIMSKDLHNFIVQNGHIGYIDYGATIASYNAEQKGKF